MLVAATADNRSQRTRLSKARVLAVLGRRSLPSLLEATVVPAILFYVCIVYIGDVAAMVAVLGWSYSAVLRRVVRRRRIPAILMLAVVGLTIRTVLGIVSGTFVYFVQPVLTTTVLAAIFFGSLVVGRPIIARFATDFCPLGPDVASRPAVIRLFSGLTLMWAGVHLLTAGITFALLVSLPTTTFVAAKTLVSLAITVGAIVVTVSWSIRTARGQELVFARAFA